MPKYRDPHQLVVEALQRQYDVSTRLRAVSELRMFVDDLEPKLVLSARRAGRSWEVIAHDLQRSKQGVWERYRGMVSGKVRDIHEVDDDHLLIVVSDRMSAFDVVLNELVPHKGRVLTALTAFWSEELGGIAPTHVVTADPSRLPSEAKELTDAAGRATLVRRADMIDIECIVRGYLSGSAWKEYRTSGTIHGMPAPKGLQESDALPEPVFTPSTKGGAGEHDENITFEQAVDIVGKETADEAREISLAYYRRGAEIARERGILIADTKFELGYIDGKLSVCDEIMTPDSSRFWDVETWKPGSTPPSYDKQPLRDWLESTGWDKKPPPPAVPAEVLRATSDLYIGAYERITGKSFSDWYGVGAA